MATLGTQNISTTFPQVLKTFGSNIVDGTLRAIASGDEAGVSALQISTTGAKSTGTFAVDGATTLTGAVTFGSSITASTGTNTLGTISVNTATIGTFSTLDGCSITTTATMGTAKVGATGPSITKISHGTSAFTSATVQQYNAADSTTGTFNLTGAALGDIVYGSITSLGSATGTVNLSLSFYPVATDVVRYSIQNQGSTNGTIPAGTIHAAAIRFA